MSLAPSSWRLTLPSTAGMEADSNKAAAQLDELKKFALTVFGNADRTDQMGARDKNLVQKYMAAGTFFQALELNKSSGLDTKEAELLRCAPLLSMVILTVVSARRELLVGGWVVQRRLASCVPMAVVTLGRHGSVSQTLCRQTHFMPRHAPRVPV